MPQCTPSTTIKQNKRISFSLGGKEWVTCRVWLDILYLFLQIHSPVFHSLLCFE
jgi:hypothetical protein